MLWLDLRAEPMVISVPAVPRARYYSVQLTDGNAYNYGYIGSRATGIEAGNYLVAGPGWKGETPAGIRKVFQSTTPFALTIFRTQLFNAADMPNVEKVQAGYKAQPLSAFLKQPAPPAAPKIDFLPATTAGIKANFYEYLDAALQFVPETAEDKAIRARLATIGIGPGKTFAFKDLSLEHKAAILLAMKEGDDKVDKYLATGMKDINGWKVGSVFGDRDFYNGDWLKRAAAAKGGIYGNDAVEAMYPMTRVDAHRRDARRQQAQLHAHLPRGPAAAGERVLVGDDVRRQDAAADRESDQSLPDQFADAAGDEEECGWFADALHPEGFAGQGEGSQLAARAQRHRLPRDAPVLAEGHAAVDPAAGRGNVEAPGHRGVEIGADENVLPAIASCGWLEIGRRGRWNASPYRSTKHWRRNSMR